jgi:hypothetical protein
MDSHKPTFRLSFLCSEVGSSKGIAEPDRAGSKTEIPGGLAGMILGLRRTLLFDLDRTRSATDEWEEAEEARRWRCMWVGSTPGSFAKRANKDKTSKTNKEDVNGSWI